MRYLKDGSLRRLVRRDRLGRVHTPVLEAREAAFTAFFDIAHDMME